MRQVAGLKAVLLFVAMSLLFVVVVFQLTRNPLLRRGYTIWGGPVLQDLRPGAKHTLRGWENRPLREFFEHREIAQVVVLEGAGRIPAGLVFSLADSLWVSDLQFRSAAPAAEEEAKIPASMLVVFRNGEMMLLQVWDTYGRIVVPEGVLYYDETSNESTLRQGTDALPGS